MVYNKPKTEHALKLSISKDVFNHLYDKMISRRHFMQALTQNSENIIQLLVIMCTEGTSHEGASNLLRDKIDCARIPTKQLTHQSTGRIRGDGVVRISPIDPACPVLLISQQHL